MAAGLSWMSLRARLKGAWPGGAVVIGGSLGWGLAMAASAALTLRLRTDWQSAELGQVLLLYFFSAVIAFLPALLLGRIIGYGRPFGARFAANFLTLAILTVGLTALLFALDYRTYYAQWHGHDLSLLWAFQFVFTVLAAVYQFAVVGLGLYLPLGGLALLAASFMLAKGAPHGRAR